MELPSAPPKPQSRVGNHFASKASTYSFTLADSLQPPNSYPRQVVTMKKFGLGKKKDDGDEDKQRSALFGGRSKNKSPNPQTANPYANLPTAADAYNSAKANAGVPGYAQRGPSPATPAAQPGGRGGYLDEKKGGYGGMNGGYPDEKKSGGYGGMNHGPPQNDGGYGADRYRAQSGYGTDRHGGGSSQAESGSSRYGPGGYGGLGPASNAADDNRDALFGGAKERVQKQTNQQMGYGQPPPYEEGQSGDQLGGYGGGSSYEAYGDRQLTAEEEEEEDVQATKQQIRFIKQEDVSSTRNALRIAAQAEETG